MNEIPTLGYASIALALLGVALTFIGGSRFPPMKSVVLLGLACSAAAVSMLFMV